MALRRNQDTPCWFGVLDWGGDWGKRPRGKRKVYHLQDTIVVVGEGFVPMVCQRLEEGLRVWEKAKTIIHTPLRS